MLTYLLSAFDGPAAAFMYALLAVLAFAMAVTIERAVSLSRFRVDGTAAVARALSGGAMGETPLERVLAEGMTQADPELSAEAMMAAAVEAELRVRRRVAYLSTVASIATMIGLFGTVYGLILAFGAMGDVGAAERAARLSQGTSTSMATTAFGLLVAIPALVAHAIIDGIARERLGEIEAAASRFLVGRKAARL